MRRTAAARGCAWRRAIRTSGAGEMAPPPWEAAWLSPWQAVQRMVSRVGDNGPFVAGLCSQEELRHTSLPRVMRELQLQGSRGVEASKMLYAAIDRITR